VTLKRRRDEKERPKTDRVRTGVESGVLEVLFERVHGSDLVKRAKMSQPKDGRTKKKRNEEQEKTDGARARNGSRSIRRSRESSLLSFENLDL